MTVVDLLAAFSGGKSKPDASLLEYSANNRIVGVEIHAVGTDRTAVRFSGLENVKHAVNNIVRITTADGFEGVSGIDTYSETGFSDDHLLELQDVAADLLALESLDPVAVGVAIKHQHPGLSDAARSSIDIALWDLAARRADLPLYQLLGAKRNSTEPYASLPFYESLPETLDAVNAYAKLGYKTFKFHGWGQLEEDLRLVELVQQTYSGSPYHFMMDLESKYTIEEALRLGGKMDEGPFIWMEAPIDDALLQQYGELKKRLGVSIIPDGYFLYSPEFIQEGISLDAWDAGRFDATVVGGISKAIELLMIANDAGLPIEIQSWGHTLSQAANLHLMLANEKTCYFEAPMPTSAYEFGMKNSCSFNGERVVAPAGPGLGFEVDWNVLTSADFYVKAEISDP
jgi:L-alanine-DL-glutamate epimerase-like enolase superfamily enzyme